MEFTVSQVAAMIGGKVEGKNDDKVTTISPIENAKKGSISFLSNAKYEPHLYTTEASAVIIGDDFKPSKAVNTALIRVADAYASFTALLEQYQKLINFQKSGVENPSFVSDQGTKYGENLYLGAFGYIGDNVSIGNNVKIYPHAYIGDNVKIGDNTIIYSGAKIYAGSIVGSYCVIHAGAVIGSDGFGFAPQEDGTYKTIPQVGNVIIEDHVDIGANTVIDCATFNSTIIKKGVKLDNLIQVAHNAEIGENTVIAAQAGIAGSTKVGKNCVIGGQVGIAGHIKVADHVKVQAQSGISKANKPGSALYGTPAIEYTNYIKSYSIFRKLPTVMKKIEELEEKMINLTNSGQ